MGAEKDRQPDRRTGQTRNAAYWDSRIIIGTLSLSKF